MQWIFVLCGCMFLLSLIATYQVCTVSLKAGLYTYNALEPTAPSGSLFPGGRLWVGAAAHRGRSATQTEAERGYASDLLLISGFVNIPRMNWTISYYNERLEQDILHMPAGILARYLRYVDLMTVHGPNLGMPHSRALGDGLLELRLQAKEGIGRVLYCTLTGQRIVMLHQFIKKSQKTPKQELALAKTRLRLLQ